MYNAIMETEKEQLLELLLTRESESFLLEMQRQFELSLGENDD